MFGEQVMVRDATREETLHWDTLVGSFRNHRVTHTLGWVRSLEDAGKGRALLLVFEKRGEIVGCLPGLLVEFGPLLRVFGSPPPGAQTISMGPAFDEKKIAADEMIPPLVRFLERRHKVLQIEIISDKLDRAAMSKSRFRESAQTTYRAPLFPDDEDRAMQALKKNARRDMKRGIKLGLITRFRDDEEFVDEIYDQITEVFARGGNTVSYGKKRVESFFRRMKEAGSLMSLGVYLPDGETCIATGLFAVRNKELLLWSWTTRTAHRWYSPTELMTWTAMRRAMEMGCESFDLMGLGNGGYKAKFGAEFDTNNLRWVRSRYRWLTPARDLALKCYHWQQSVRGQLARRRLNNQLSPAEPSNASGL